MPTHANGEADRLATAVVIWMVAGGAWGGVGYFINTQRTGEAFDELHFFTTVANHMLAGFILAWLGEEFTVENLELYALVVGPHVDRVMNHIMTTRYKPVPDGGDTSAGAGSGSGSGAGATPAGSTGPSGEMNGQWIWAGVDRIRSGGATQSQPEPEPDAEPPDDEPLNEYDEYIGGDGATETNTPPTSRR